MYRCCVCDAPAASPCECEQNKDDHQQDEPKINVASGEDAMMMMETELADV